MTKSRVSLDSLVYAYRTGLSAEEIHNCFPVLTLRQVYGAIVYYLDHQPEIDAYLMESEAEYEVHRQASHDADPAFYEKLESSRTTGVVIR